MTDRLEEIARILALGWYLGQYEGTEFEVEDAIETAERLHSDWTKRAEQVRSVLAGLESKRKEPGWRPIESAPKDGTPFEQRVINIHKARWAEDDDGYEWREPLTHPVTVAVEWRPLPAPTTTTGSGDGR